MPSTATITAFYSFTANTKARASYVNTNFSNYRGHIIAIDPNTTTAATTETYDIGSTEYRWRTGYYREIDVKANTTTGQALQIVGDTAAGQGAMLLKHAGNTRARIGGGNQYIDLDTTTSQFDFKSNSGTLTSMSATKWASNIPTTTGQWDFLQNGVTLTSIKVNGFERNILKPTTFWQSAMVTTGNYNISTAGGSNAFLVSTLSVTSNGHCFYVGLNLKTQQTTGAIYLSLSNTTTGTGFCHIDIYRDGTANSDRVARLTTFVNAKDTSTSNGDFVHPRTWCFDPSCTSGGHTYYCYGVVNTGLMSFQQATMFQAIELI